MPMNRARPTRSHAAAFSAEPAKARTMDWAPRFGFLPIVIVFVATRLLTVILLRPGGFFGDWSDFYYFKEMAELSDQGYYPYIHFWVEYPPLFPWLVVGAYRLSLLLPAFRHPLFWFQLFTSSLLIAADVGSLCLVRRIGARLWGERRGTECAWLWTGLFLPLYGLAVWFDTLPVFFLLLGLELLLERRPLLAGLATGLGGAAKLIPLLLVPVAARSLRGPRRLALYIVCAILAPVATLVPFWFLGRPMLLASLQGMFTRRSWETVWALADGYYGTGGVPALRDRLLYAASADWSSPSRVPWPLVTLIFSFVYAIVWLVAEQADESRANPLDRARLTLAGFLRQREIEARTADDAVGRARLIVALAGFTVAAFLLFSKGFSQQFTLYLLPFVVLLAPGVTGALLAVALIVNNTLIEGYLFVNLFPTDHWLLRATIIVRTVLLLGFAIYTAGLLVPEIGRHWQKLRRVLWLSAAIASISLTVGFGIRLSGAYWQQTLDQNPKAAAVRALQAEPTDARLLYVGRSIDSFAYAYTRPRPVLVLDDPKLPERRGRDSLHARLMAFAEGAGRIVLVEGGTPEALALSPAATSWIERSFRRVGESEVAGVRLVEYVPRELPRLLEPARFGDEITLVGAELGTASIRAGEPLSVRLFWKASRKPGHDYTVFVHLVVPAPTGAAPGQIVAQRDTQPLGGRYPTTDWQAGESVADELTIDLPSEIAAGEYTLVVGVYDQATGQRLPIAGQPAGRDSLDLGSALGSVRVLAADGTR